MFCLFLLVAIRKYSLEKSVVKDAYDQNFSKLSYLHLADLYFTLTGGNYSEIRFIANIPD